MQQQGFRRAQYLPRRQQQWPSLGFCFQRPECVLLCKRTYALKVWPLMIYQVNQYTHSKYNSLTLPREQLSSKDRLWCQDSCRKETLDHYFCTTLYGIDHCSPRQGKNSFSNFSCMFLNLIFFFQFEF